MKLEPLNPTAPSPETQALAARISAARFTFEHGLFSGKTFLTAFRICLNPCCPCGVIGFVCQVLDAPDQTIRFDLDVFERRLITEPESAPEGMAVGKAFLAEVEAEEWQWLGNLFLTTKRREIETMNLDTLDVQLPTEVLEGDGTIVGYC